MKRRTAAARAAVTALATTALAAGCGSSDDSGSGPVELTYWAWAPGLERVVEIWNEANPDVQVTVKEQAGGDDLVTKTLTAAQAGNAPDLMQAEYQALPTLVSNDVLADISGEDAVAGAADAFGEAEWQQVTLGTDAVYALPQDSGPMMLYYRHDLFEEYGLTVPETWEEFADTARELRAADPDKVLTTFSANDPGLFAGLAQQAGAAWWSPEGEEWRVAIDDEATARVAEFWGELVEEGAIGNQPMYTPAWNQALHNGDQLAWVSAVWAPGTLASAVPDTAGSWSMAPLPQWSAGERATGSWGGSSTAVTTDSEHPQAAAEFAAWLNTDPEAVAALVRESGVYPAATAAQTSDALAEPPEFFAHQEDFYAEAAEIAAGTAPAAWGPNVNVAYNAFNDAFGDAARDRSDFRDALGTVHEATVADLRDLGFQVAE